MGIDLRIAFKTMSNNENANREKLEKLVHDLDSDENSFHFITRRDIDGGLLGPDSERVYCFGTSHRWAYLEKPLDYDYHDSMYQRIVQVAPHIIKCYAWGIENGFTLYYGDDYGDFGYSFSDTIRDSNLIDDKIIEDLISFLEVDELVSVLRGEND